jgi:hypothetical protein
MVLGHENCGLPDHHDADYLWAGPTGASPRNQRILGERRTISKDEPHLLTDACGKAPVDDPWPSLVDCPSMRRIPQPTTIWCAARSGIWEWLFAGPATRSRSTETQMIDATHVRARRSASGGEGGSETRRSRPIDSSLRILYRLLVARRERFLVRLCRAAIGGLQAHGVVRVGQPEVANGGRPLYRSCVG